MAVGACGPQAPLVLDWAELTESCLSEGEWVLY